MERAVPERELSWWDYLKAAFRFRPPLKWVGAIPLNQLLLYAGLLFAFLFLIAHQTAAALGVLMLTSAAEICYLYTLSTLPRFRHMIAADLAAAAREQETSAAERAVRLLSRGSIERYRRLTSDTAEIERLLTDRQDDTQTPWADALQTGGLDEIRALFGRLLEHRERVAAHFNTRSVQEFPAQLRRLEQELKSQHLTSPVRHSKEQTLAVLRQRARQLEQMKESSELAEAELQRLEQHLALLKDQAATASDPTALTSQIDEVVTGMTDTTDWLLESERLLGDPDVGLGEQTVDA